MEIRIDKEFQGYCRNLTPQEYSLLEESILQEGCRDPIVVWKDIILDGHHRYKICQKHEIEFNTVEAEQVKTREDALVWMFKNQVGKRNIGWFEKAELGIRAFKPLVRPKEGKGRRKKGTGGWYEKVTELIGTGHTTIYFVDQALSQLPEEDLIKLRSGKMSQTILRARLGYKNRTKLSKRRNIIVTRIQEGKLELQRVNKAMYEANQEVKGSEPEIAEMSIEYNVPWEDTEHVTGRKKRMTVDIERDGMSVVVLPDIHAQVTSKDEGRVSSAAQVALDFLDEFKPDVTIVLGDLLDLSQLSYYTKKKPRLIEGLRLDKDYALGNQILNRIDKATKGERVFLEGNHEVRVESYLDENPGLEGMLSVKKNLHLEERGWKFLKEGELLKIGHAYFIHGWYYNVYHARKHVAEMGDNIFYGHTHDVQSFSKPNPDTMPIISQSLGCLCDLNPGWLRNKPSRWVNAFGIFYFSKDRSFTYYVPIIINGSFWWNGKRWGK